MTTQDASFRQVLKWIHEEATSPSCSLHVAAARLRICAKYAEGGLKLADEKLSKQDKRIAELENCIRQILKTDDKHGKRVRFDHARLCLNVPMICGEG